MFLIFIFLSNNVGLLNLFLKCYIASPSKVTDVVPKFKKRVCDHENTYFCDILSSFGYYLPLLSCTHTPNLSPVQDTKSAPEI